MLTSRTTLLAAFTIGSAIALGACATDGTDTDDSTTSAITAGPSKAIRVTRKSISGDVVCDMLTLDPEVGFQRADCPPQSGDDAAASATKSVVVPDAVTNYIGNEWTQSLGVIHVKDGSYTHGNYDAALPPDTDTVGAFAWTTTAGWYIGPGYFSKQVRSDNGGPWTATTDLPSGQHFIGANTSYVVNVWSCSLYPLEPACQ
jgi:hypothetical protein